MNDNQRAEIAWQGGVPVSTRFDDPYFSLQDGLAETRHTFLDGNDLPARFREGFHIAELGFGTGLNLLAAVDLWRNSGVPGPLRYTSFEAYPPSREDMSRALYGFAGIDPEWLLDASPSYEIDTEFVSLRVVLGDARETLPAWTGKADAWFLDGFSPAKNPELWQGDLLAEVGRHTVPGGSFATYTAAGYVRRSLENAGFRVERRPGFGRKRHMSVGQLA